MAINDQNSEGWFEGTQGNQEPNAAIDSKSLPDYIDYAFRENGGPGYGSALVNMLRGIRILGPGNQLAPIPDDTIGLAFVTRPLLNLSDSNVIKHPQLAPLYRPQKNTHMAYIKGLLDPKWGRANSGLSDTLDPLYPWMSPLTNLLKVSSGFPDLSLAVGKSGGGFRKEVYQWANGVLKVNYDFEMRQSYYTPKPNILPYIFEAWVHYIEAVTLGDEGLEPYPEALIENYLDYDCRIYHMILNKNMRNIEWLFCNASCFPTTFPSGAFSTIDRTQNTLRGQGQDELEIGFSCVGFRFGNIRIADMFNRTTLKFNPGMHPAVRDTTYRKLDFSEYFAGGYAAIPWININTMELEQWSKI